MEELKIQSLSSLINKQFPESKWLVEKLVPESGFVLMTAAPSSFKTWLALEISLCVADEKPLFNTFKTVQGNVLICDEESGDRMLQDRFKKLGVKNAENPWDEKPIYYLSRIGRQIDDSYVEELLAECKKRNIKLAIFDSLTRFHSARENDSVEMAKILNFFKILNDNGIATLILHHNRKSSSGAYGGGNFGGGEMVRGSSDILASCDIHLSTTVNKRDRKITIIQTKNRYMEEIKPFSVRLKVINENRSEFEFISEEDDKDSQMIELKNIVIQQITENPGINKSQLISSVARDYNGFSNNRIAVAINELLNENKLKTEQGIKNSCRLFINEN